MMYRSIVDVGAIECRAGILGTTRIESAAGMFDVTERQRRKENRVLRASRVSEDDTVEVTRSSSVSEISTRTVY